MRLMIPFLCKMAIRVAVTAKVWKNIANYKGIGYNGKDVINFKYNHSLKIRRVYVYFYLRGLVIFIRNAERQCALPQ